MTRGDKKKAAAYKKRHDEFRKRLHEGLNRDSPSPMEEPGSMPRVPIEGAYVVAAVGTYVVGWFYDLHPILIGFLVFPFPFVYVYNRCLFLRTNLKFGILYVFAVAVVHYTIKLCGRVGELVQNVVRVGNEHFQAMNGQLRDLLIPVGILICAALWMALNSLFPGHAEPALNWLPPAPPLPPPPPPPPAISWLPMWTYSVENPSPPPVVTTFTQSGNMFYNPVESAPQVVSVCNRGELTPKILRKSPVSSLEPCLRPGLTAEMWEDWVNWIVRIEYRSRCDPTLGDLALRALIAVADPDRASSHGFGADPSFVGDNRDPSVPPEETDLWRLREVYSAMVQLVDDPTPYDVDSPGPLRAPMEALAAEMRRFAIDPDKHKRKSTGVSIIYWLPATIANSIGKFAVVLKAGVGTVVWTIAGVLTAAAVVAFLLYEGSSGNLASLPPDAPLNTLWEYVRPLFAEVAKSA